MSGKWYGLTNQPDGTKNNPKFSAGVMLLLTDGTVMVQDVDTPNWHRFTPDSSGHYQNGTWSSLESSTNLSLAGSTPIDYAPGCYASAVLRDGRVIVCGGEYNGGIEVDTSICAIFDQTQKSPNRQWKLVASPPFSNFAVADAPCCILADGRFLLGSAGADPSGQGSALWDPKTETWSTQEAFIEKSYVKGGANFNETTWTLLPDGTVLCPTVGMAPAVYRYTPSPTGIGQWNPDTDCSQILASAAPASEIGPAILQPDGTVIAFGALGHNAIFDPKASDPTKRWTNAPDFPFANGNQMGTADAPAVLLPNGNILVMAGQGTGHSGGPVEAYEFCPASPGVAQQFQKASTPPNAISTNYNEDICMLLLPDGTVMASIENSNIQIWEPIPYPSSPAPNSSPHISSVPTVMRPGDPSIKIEGLLFNGVSQATSFGDDLSNATNYPLVYIQNSATKHVRYCWTHDHSTMGVATSGPVWTLFDVPSDIELGPSVLHLVANGIEADNPQTVNICVRAITVSVQGTTLPPKVGIKVPFSVTAVDSGTGATIPGASVEINGVVYGQTGQTIDYNFAPKVTTTTQVATNVKPGLIITKTVYPKCTVNVPLCGMVVPVNLGFVDTVTETKTPPQH